MGIFPPLNHFWSLFGLPPLPSKEWHLSNESPRILSFGQPICLFWGLKPLRPGYASSQNIDHVGAHLKALYVKIGIPRSDFVINQNIGKNSHSTSIANIPNMRTVSFTGCQKVSNKPLHVSMRCVRPIFMFWTKGGTKGKHWDWENWAVQFGAICSPRYWKKWVSGKLEPLSLEPYCTHAIGK